MTSNQNKEAQSPKSSPETIDYEDYGFAPFPKRLSEESKEESKKMFHTNDFGEYWTRHKHKKCLKNIAYCVNNDAIVKLMMSALKSKGCEVDLGRHFSCEECYGPAGGGYDVFRKQLVLCENKQKNKLLTCATMRHEMLHAFDDCRAKLDINNMEHIACSEIRAANLTSCNFLKAWTQSYLPFARIKASHQYCVKEKALTSLMAMRNVNRDEGMEIVNKVFDRCYNDMEPLGLRPRTKTYLNDSRKAIREARYYGYRTGEPLDQFDT